MSQIKLTEYSHGAGCGCKISPALLDDISKTSAAPFIDPRLLVAVDAAHEADFIQVARELSLQLAPLGELTAADSQTPLICIK